LLARKRVIEALQANRTETVHLFNELAKQVPEGIYLRTLVQTGQKISITGYAQSNARITTLMNNLDESPLLERSTLVETKAETVASRRLNAFSITTMITRQTNGSRSQAGACAREEMMKLPSLSIPLFKKKSPAEKRTADKQAAKPESAAPKAPLIDFQQLAMDFKTLDPKDPGLWPLAPRVVILLSLFVALIAAAWGFGGFGWSVQLEELEAKKNLGGQAQGRLDQQEATGCQS
jgi:hypothetical protein